MFCFGLNANAVPAPEAPSKLLGIPLYSAQSHLLVGPFPDSPTMYSGCVLYVFVWLLDYCSTLDHWEQGPCLFLNHCYTFLRPRTVWVHSRSSVNHLGIKERKKGGREGGWMPGVKRLIALLYKILSKMGSYDTHHFWRAEGSTHFELMRDTHMQARSQPQFPHP